MGKQTSLTLKSAYWFPNCRFFLNWQFSNRPWRNFIILGPPKAQVPRARSLVDPLTPSAPTIRFRWVTCAGHPSTMLGYLKIICILRGAFFTVVVFLKLAKLRKNRWNIFKSHQTMYRNVLIATKQYLVMIRFLIFMSNLTFQEFSMFGHFLSNIYVKNDIF